MVSILIIAIANIFFGISRNESESMEPTLYDGDWILFVRYVNPAVSGIFFVVSPHDENKKIIKRITAVVSPNYFYVLGDHKGEYWDADLGEMAVSFDSRSFGPVHRFSIHERVVLVFWPPQHVRWLW